MRLAGAAQTASTWPQVTPGYVEADTMAFFRRGGPAAVTVPPR